MFADRAVDNDESCTRANHGSDHRAVLVRVTGARMDNTAADSRFKCARAWIGDGTGDIEFPGNRRHNVIGVRR